MTALSRIAMDRRLVEWGYNEYITKYAPNVAIMITPRHLKLAVPPPCACVHMIISDVISAFYVCEVLLRIHIDYAKNDGIVISLQNHNILYTLIKQTKKTLHGFPKQNTLHAHSFTIQFKSFFVVIKVILLNKLNSYTLKITGGSQCFFHVLFR